MYIKNKRGQSTVEYVLLVTAVVAVMIVFATGKGTGIQGQLNSTLNQVTGKIDDMTSQITNSYAPGPDNGTVENTYPVYVKPGGVQQ
jgi:Flp pilus assembly pilin Flp